MQRSAESTYHIRQATADDLQAWKAIRLEALQTDPQFFGNTYETEVHYTDADWLRGIDNPRRGAFLLCHENEVIGLTVVRLKDDDDERAALYASFIRPAHRGKGLSGLLYQARLEWAREKGVKEIVVTHRKGNDASQAANQKFGFKYYRQEMKIWPDGAEELELWYVLNLQASPTPTKKFQP